MKPKKAQYSSTVDSTDQQSKQIEQMEKMIILLQEEIEQLKYELLDCYRRLDN